MLNQVLRICSVMAMTFLAAGLLLDIAIGTIGTIERLRAATPSEQVEHAAGMHAAFTGASSTHDVER